MSCEFQFPNGIPLPQDKEEEVYSIRIECRMLLLFASYTALNNLLWQLVTAVVRSAATFPGIIPALTVSTLFVRIGSNGRLG